MFIDPKRGRQENGCGQAEHQNQFRVQGVQSGRLEVKAGKMVRQAGKKSRVRQGSKPGIDIAMFQETLRTICTNWQLFHQPQTKLKV